MSNAFINAGWSISDDAVERANRQAQENNERYWFNCSHSSHTETGMTRVYCKYCGKAGHWAYDKEKGRVIVWENN